MNFLVSFSIGLVTSQVILSLFLLARSQGSSSQQRLYGALLCGIECYFLVPLTPGTPVAWAVVAVEAAIPALFWLFSSSLFNDHFRLRKWHFLLVLLPMLLPSLGSELRAVGTDTYAPLLRGGGKLLQFSFLGMALWAVVRHWRSDLISSRRQLRVWFCVINGLYMFIFLFWRDILEYPLIWPGIGEYLVSAVVWLGTNALLLQFAPGLLLELPQRRTGHSSNRPDQEAVSRVREDRTGTQSGVSLQSRTPDHLHLPPGLLEAIRCELEENHIYRDTNLSIGQLAYKLELPEHVLRTIINRELGYRNFKDFLNGFRIRDACLRLADPEQDQVSILSVALDAGFRSLSTFNRVFKDTQGITPTAYRRDHARGGC